MLPSFLYQQHVSHIKPHVSLFNSLGTASGCRDNIGTGRRLGSASCTDSRGSCALCICPRQQVQLQAQGRPRACAQPRFGVVPSQSPWRGLPWRIPLLTPCLTSWNPRDRSSYRRPGVQRLAGLRRVRLLGEEASASERAGERQRAEGREREKKYEHRCGEA